MREPQVIRTAKGEELVVLSREDYDALVRLAALDEDAAIARIIDDSDASLEAGKDIVIPATVAEAIASGENPIRVLREWRGLTQQYLGEMTEGLSQAYVSQLERGERQGTVEVLRRIARTLRVPVDLLILD